MVSSLHTQEACLLYSPSNTASGTPPFLSGALTGYVASWLTSGPLCWILFLSCFCQFFLKISASNATSWEKPSLTSLATAKFPIICSYNNIPIPLLCDTTIIIWKISARSSNLYVWAITSTRTVKGLVYLFQHTVGVKTIFVEWMK